MTPPAAPHSAVAAVRDALGVVVGPGERVVLAVSGGRDSVGMAHLVCAARPDLQPCVGHVRHGLRDDAPDAAAAQQCAHELGLDAHVVSVTVHPSGTGPEDAARQARMAALEAIAQQTGARFVMTGHTADDNAETMLLNLARGSGLAGLAGIPAVRRLGEETLLVRPVLALRREQVRDVAAAAAYAVVDDPTNDDPAQRRARARSTLLPLLQSLTGGDTDAVESLQRLARTARTDVAALDSLSAAQAQRYVQRWADFAVVPLEQLRLWPRAIAVRVVRDVVADVAGAVPGMRTIEAVLALQDGQMATVTGDVMASAGGGNLAVGKAAARLPERRLTGECLALPEVALHLRADPPSDDEGWLPPWAPASAARSVGSRRDGIVVRSRQPGDRITTAAGTQTVADAMVNAGVPRIARDLVPVVADDDGPLWIPGVAVRAGAGGGVRLKFVASAAK